MTQPIPICCDGSAGEERAVDTAVALLARHEAGAVRRPALIVSLRP